MPKSNTGNDAIAIALCTSPLFLVAAYFGHKKEGLGAMICTSIITIIGRDYWPLRRDSPLAYWLVILFGILLEFLFVRYIPWGADGVRGTYKLLPIAAAYYFMLLGGFKYVDNKVSRGKAKAEHSGHL